MSKKEPGLSNRNLELKPFAGLMLVKLVSLVVDVTAKRRLLRRHSGKLKRRSGWGRVTSTFGPQCRQSQEGVDTQNDIFNLGSYVLSQSVCDRVVTLSSDTKLVEL